MYLLPGVHPWVKTAAEEVGPKFGIKTIYGVSAGSTPGSDHPRGLALDFMVYSDRANGNAVAAYVLANASRLSVKYVIWFDRIWEPGTGWKPYAHPSGRTDVTARHEDHVHVSFLSHPGTGGAPVAADTQGFGIPNPIDAAGDVVRTIKQFTAAMQDVNKVLQWLLNPRNWLRIAAFVSGSILIVIALFTVDKVKTVTKTVAKGAVNAAS